MPHLDDSARPDGAVLVLPELSDDDFGGIELWHVECRRCEQYTAWFLDDAPEAANWGDEVHFRWYRKTVPFGSHAHELAIWNHSRMWDDDPLPREPNPVHDACWEAFGYDDP